MAVSLVGEMAAPGQKESLGMDLLSAYRVVSEANSFAHLNDATVAFYPYGHPTAATPGLERERKEDKECYPPNPSKRYHTIWCLFIVRRQAKPNQKQVLHGRFAYK